MSLDFTKKLFGIYIANVWQTVKIGYLNLGERIV